MLDEAKVTVRNIGLLLLQRGLHIIGSFLFALFIPRLMGTENFGRLALMTSLAIWFGLFSDLGFTQVVMHYIPQFKLQGDTTNLRRLFNHILSVSFFSGFISAALYLLFTLFRFKDLNTFLLTTMAGTVMVTAWAQPFFVLFLGLNQAALWGMKDILSRWISILLLIIGFYLKGLEGACLGLLITGFIVLLSGLRWGWSYLSWPGLKVDIRYLFPYLRFGLIFFIISLVHISFQRSGEVLVRLLINDYAQVGFFGLTYNIYLTISMPFWQFTFAFTPFFSSLKKKGDVEALKQWIEHLLKWLAIGDVLMIFAVLLIGNDLVPIVLGRAYHPVIKNLIPLSITLLVIGLSQIATLLTIIYNRPQMALSAAILRLVIFWSLGIPLISRWGSLGGCIAILLASTFYSFYFTWRIKAIVKYPLKKWIGVISFGTLFLPLLWLRSSFLANIGLYSLFVTSFFCILFFLKIITRGEVRDIGHALLSKELVSAPIGEGGTPSP